jgi:hypothetical protein
MQTRRQFIGTALALGAFGAIAARAEDKGPALHAGAGRADVEFPPTFFPIEGFVAQHDPLAARVLLLDSGGTRLAIAVVDVTSMPPHMVAGMKAILGRIAGVPRDQAIVCASHTFSAPHVPPVGEGPPGSDPARNEALLRRYEAALESAATQAVGALQPATLGYGEGICRVGVNRDLPTAHGWWLGSNDEGFSDPTIGVLRVNGRDGSPLAILLNASVQSSIMDGSQRADGGKLITSDLAGAAARYIEQHYGRDAVALFLVGAAGDQAPTLQANRHVAGEDGSVTRVDVHDAGFLLVDLLGEKLGDAAVRVSNQIHSMPSPALAVVRDGVDVDALTFSPRTPPRGPVSTYTYQPGGKTVLPFVLLQIGELALVGMAPELSASIGARIVAGSPYRHTIVATMVDGAAKYLPERQAYGRYTYEARNSPYAAGSAELAASVIDARLKRMYDEQH